MNRTLLSVLYTCIITKYFFLFLISLHGLAAPAGEINEIKNLIDLLIDGYIDRHKYYKIHTELRGSFLKKEENLCLFYFVVYLFYCCFFHWSGYEARQ